MAMKPNRMASNAPPAERDDADTPGGHRRIDSLDQPARPLGAKRAALQLRRQRPTRAPRQSSATPGLRSACTLTSCDGRTTFTLHPTTEGLLIDRTQLQLIGSRLTQSMVFADQPAFDRWCSAEPLRFEDAVLFGHLVREGHGAFIGPW
jgi:hypothetical protein